MSSNSIFSQSSILVDVRGPARLGGFGVTLLPPDTPGVEIDRFFHGAAPELVECERFGLTDTRATKASDVYAFGVLVWEVSGAGAGSRCNSLNGMLRCQTFAGEVPFSSMTKIAAVVSMWDGCRPARPNHPELSNRLWGTVRACWKAHPRQRTTITQVVAVFEEKVAVHQSKCW